MTPDDFAHFYEAVHGYEPFPWQRRLARQVTDKGWPAVLAVPTAAGKTSAIDVALFTLALQAGKSLAERTAPLRIFFVIDRRLVVDQAAAHARKLKRALENPDAPAVLREVARSLAEFGGPGPLHVSALRGGMYRDDSWARAPNQPTVCVSTIDQVGSRLLFRGYGLSEFRWPVHAGLTGTDALYLIDEAHLAGPFLETLHAVRRYRDWAEQPVPGPFAAVEMSATPQTSGERFALEGSDLDNPVLSRRLGVTKPANLHEPARFEQEAVEAARQALDREAVRVVGIVVNRVASARRVFEDLRSVRGADALLLTGRIRPWDRERLLAEWLPRMKAGRSRNAKHRPLFVVATQTVEVGADLDFDYLVTEAAPLPALRQRFGRLDRLGQFGTAAGTILLRRNKYADPIYGEDLSSAWDWLLQRSQGEAIDFGVTALDEAIRHAGQPPPAPAERHAPVVFPSLLDTLVQTSPVPQPDPDVAPFLHGADALDAADVQIVWRADLSVTDPSQWIETVASARPVVLEALPVMVGAARAWLQDLPPPEVADVEGSAGEPQPEADGNARPVLRWRGPDNSEVIDAGQIRPGDTLVVPSAYGGADEFGWCPGRRQPVRDVCDSCFNWLADAAAAGGRQRPIRVRLHPELYRQLLPESRTEDERTEQDRRTAEFARRVGAACEALDGDDGGDSQATLQPLLASYRDVVEPDSILAAAIDRLLQAGRLSSRLYPGGLVLTGRAPPGFSRSPRPLPAEAADADEPTAEDDTASLTRPVSLADHAAGVAAWVGRFAKGLDDRLLQALELAARLHDLGKADPRFQTMLYGGDAVAAAAGKPLAKSGMNSEDRAAFWQAWRQSGLPRGFRHEFVSVAFLRNDGADLLGDLSGEERDLVEYLVGAHHGRGRPFVPVVDDPDPEPVVLDWDGLTLSASPRHGLWRLGSGWTDLFWRLVRRYGYWGLAYLEAVLVLADQARSLEEERTHE